MRLRNVLHEVDLDEAQKIPYLTVNDFAKKNHLTPQAVLARVRKKTLKAFLIMGRIVIDVTPKKRS